MDAHGCVFNRIAGIYQWFFQRQKRHYRKELKSIFERLQLPPRAKILDLGCGTGAFGYVFQERGFDVIGVDIAPKMVQKGIENQVHCIVGDILTHLPFADHSFDLVISAFMLHGLSAEKRKVVFQEARRLAKNDLLFCDYTSPNMPTSRGIMLMEKLEGGNYFGFLQTGLEEMKNHFSVVRTQKINDHLSFYLLNST